MSRGGGVAALLGVLACANAEGPPLGLDAGAPDRGPTADALPRDFGSGDPSDAGLDGGELDAEGPSPDLGISVTVLREVNDDAGVHYQLLRLQRGSGRASYAQWFPPPSGAPAPVLIQTQPYEGIDWTGEEVDQRWARLGPGLHPDADGPNYDPARSSPITYAPMAPAKGVEDSGLWRLHGFGVLFLYGRFYAGGDVDDDIQDMTAGFEFLAEREDVDRRRLGITGGSWGGFLALYGAAYARPELRPAVGVALYPISDFEVERRFVTEVLPGRYQDAASRDAAATFFEPYLRRIDATTARRGGFQGLRAADLLERIDAPFLLVHEDWDTLVSFEQSTHLASQAPAHFLPFWLEHPGPPEPWDQALNQHGLLLNQLGPYGLYTFVWAHLLVRLGGAAQPLYIPYSAAPLRALLTQLRGAQLSGLPVDFLAERLRDLCDPRASSYELNTQVIAPGPETVAVEFNAVWGTSFDGPGACAQLAIGLPD